MNRTLVYISLATFSFWLAAQMIRPIFPLYISELGANTFEIGLIVSLPNLLSIFIRVPLTTLPNRFGRYKFLGISLFINFLSLFLYGLSYSLGLIYIARVLHALAIASFGPVATASVSILTPRNKRSGIMGSFLTLIALAVVVGPAITSILSMAFDLYLIFIIASIPSILFSLILFNQEEDEVLDDMDGGGKDLRISVFDILKNRYFLIISITALTYSLSNGFFRSFFPIYIKDYYLLGAAYVSTLYFVRGLFNLFSRPITGSFAGRIGIGRLVFIGMSISVVPFVILYYKPLLPLIVFAMVLSGIGWGMRAVSSVSLISLSLHRDEQDVGMALFYNMFDIGVFIGSTLGGFLSIYLPLNVLFGMYSIVLLVGTIASIHLWNAKV